MIRYELTDTDLADVRFAVSPVNELVLSLRALHRPELYPLQRPWMRLVRDRQATLNLPVLRALASDRGRTPDYLTPPPHAAVTRIEAEFAQISRADNRVVERDLRTVHLDGPLPEPLHGPIGVVRERIVDALSEYWRVCFEPHWARMRTVLEGDVTHRGRQITQRGFRGMFPGLAEQIGFAGNVVSVRMRYPPAAGTERDGDGLTLVPTLWTSNPTVPTSDAGPASIMYAARGQASMWAPQPRVAVQTLVQLLGETRAHLLLRLGTPASSTELAVRLGVTTSAVNQHLRALRAAGLLDCVRHGRSVLYHWSDLGRNMCLRAGAVERRGR
jgi:DNA-binding transcriptional ArsR family regulator